jgi:uncharacterized membrane protein YhaH (DUF805 family)
MSAQVLIFALVVCLTFLGMLAIIAKYDRDRGDDLMVPALLIGIPALSLGLAALVGAR